MNKIQSRKSFNPVNHGSDIIGGGLSNKICAGTCHASIFGGQNNCVWGNCSAILGGLNNCDNGYAFTGIFGNAVKGLGPLVSGQGGFFVNETVIQNLPFVGTSGCYTSFLMPGETYTDVAPGTGFTASQLYIR